MRRPHRSTWRSLTALRALASGLTTLTVPGCTLVSDFGVHQCSSDSDCRTFAGDTLRCAESRCVAGCQDNRQCAVLDPRYPICRGRGDSCTSLTSAGDECYVSSPYNDDTMGQLTARDMTIIGAFAPSIRSSTWLTLQLAVAEFNASPAVSQPVVVVLCGDGVDVVPAGAEHLILDLGVRSIIASLEEASLLAAVSLPKIAGQALFLDPGHVPISPEASRSAGSLLWYLGGSHADVVAAYPALLRRGVGALGTAVDPPKMASLVGPTDEDEDLAQAMELAINLDGQDVGDLERRGLYKRVVFSNDSADARATQLAELVTYEPQLVWTFLGGSFAKPVGLERMSLVADLEVALAAQGVTPPLYIVGPRGVDAPTLRSLVASNPSFRERAVVINVGRDDDLAVKNALISRYAEAFPEAVAGDSSVSPPVYDALYYLAYAEFVAASNTVPITSDALLGGLSAVTDPSGTSVTVGPGAEGVDAAMASLVQLDRLDVVGTSGPANFDPELRARPERPRVYCWDADGATVPAARFDPQRADFDVDTASCAQRFFDAP